MVIKKILITVKPIRARKSKRKILNDFARRKDLYFFIGIIKLNQFRAPNPFIIIGTFQPRKEDETLTE